MLINWTPEIVVWFTDFGSWPAYPRNLGQYPDLMQRPIIEHGDRAVIGIGRPTEKIREIL